MNAQKNVNAMVENCSKKKIAYNNLISGIEAIDAQVLASVSVSEQKTLLEKK